MHREQELWALALWVEKHHPHDAREYFREQMTRLADAADEPGIAIWLAVADQYDGLQEGTGLIRK